MKKSILVILVLVIAGFGIYYMVSNNSSKKPPINYGDTSSSNTTNPNSPISTTPTPSNVSVDIKGFTYSPPVLKVKTGTKVTWTNNDNVAHTVTSDSAGLFGSSTLSPGQSFSFTFTNTGSFSYHCAIHPMMKGSVVVGN